ncbi:hypothetical protein ABT246_33660 [Streptomyces sp. NPDC001553]|uniref:hypothetical protein n=1 Tax=Streptomyces sp. NPDC001553 TaxID=3154385 RepID=UPI00332D3E0E
MDPQEAIKAEVRAAFDQYWTALTAAYAKADEQGSNLNKISSGSAYAQTLGDLVTMRKSNQVVTGKAAHSGTTIEFKQGTRLPTATVTACVDISQWKPVNKDTGKEVQLPPERRLRYITKLTAEKWSSGWMFIEEDVEGRAC